ncbi:hypothetical protein IT087_02075 [Candidatus Uhrbacteria bacterium]|nr:hypothetical protein [Candidatus Uhrbacteria bacterium]
MSERMPGADQKSAREALAKEVQTLVESLEREHPALYASQTKLEDAKQVLADLLRQVESLPEEKKSAAKALGKETGDWAIDTAMLKIPSTLGKLSSLLGGSYGYGRFGMEAPSLEKIMDAAQDLYRISKVSVGETDIVNAEADVVQAEYEHKMGLIKGNPDDVLAYHQKFGELVKKRGELESKK